MFFRATFLRAGSRVLLSFRNAVSTVTSKPFLRVAALMIFAALAVGPAAAQLSGPPIITSPSYIAVPDTPTYDFEGMYVSNWDSNTTVTIGGAAPYLSFYNATYGIDALGIDFTNGIPGNGQLEQDLVACNGSSCTTYHDFVLYSNGYTPFLTGMGGNQDANQQVNPNGGVQLEAVGIGLTHVVSVVACGQGVNFTEQNDSNIFFNAPPYNGLNPCSVTVTSVNGQTSTLSAAYSYFAVSTLPGPAITSVVPSSGVTTGGTTVTITGTGLYQNTTVTVGGVAATNITYIDDEHLTAVTPASASGAGSADIVLTNGVGTTTDSGGFTYASPASVFLADPSAGGLASVLTSGAALTSLTSGGGRGAAVDSSGNVWTLGTDGQSLVKFTKLGVVSATYSNLAGFSSPQVLAVDGAGTIWAPSKNTISLNAVKPNGTVIGAGAGFAPNTIGAGPDAIAIDQAGGIWIASKTANQITHIIGSAQPIVTPTATAVTNSTLGTKP